jgi:hypothetical protein
VVEADAMSGGARVLADAQGASSGVPFGDRRGPSAWDEPVRGPTASDWIIDRITPRPLRADRSATLVGEPPGRLDRLDLLMVLLVFVSALTLRGFRIAEPYDMYFDEVYHARTAMEFLQDWRYDDPHDIYEWTHPHLAKYAMAVGIELLGDHRVTGESSLGVPVRSAVLERRWSEDARDAQRRGDRLYVATGDDVRVYDLETRVPIGTIPAAATALALDADDHLLYLASRTAARSTSRRTSSRRAATSTPPTSRSPTLPSWCWAAMARSPRSIRRPARRSARRACPAPRTSRRCPARTWSSRVRGR